MERLVVNPEKAQALLSLQFDDEDRRRMQELMEKNNQGSISESEKAEMESFRKIGTFLGILQAKARLILKSN